MCRLKLCTRTQRHESSPQPESQAIRGRSQSPVNVLVKIYLCPHTLCTERVLRTQMQRFLIPPHAHARRASAASRRSKNDLIPPSNGAPSCRDTQTPITWHPQGISAWFLFCPVPCVIARAAAPSTVKSRFFQRFYGRLKLAGAGRGAVCPPGASCLGLTPWARAAGRLAGLPVRRGGQKRARVRAKRSK